MAFDPHIRIKSLEEELKAVKQALESESKELVKVRNQNKLLKEELAKEIKFAGEKNRQLSNVNDDLEAKIEHLEENIDALKCALKAVL